MIASVFADPVLLQNPSADPQSRVCMVSVPVQLGQRAYTGLGDVPTQVQPVGWWPEELAKQAGVVRRQLMFGVSPGALPEVLALSADDTPPAGEWHGPELECRILSKKNTGLVLSEVNEAVFRFGGKLFGLRLGLIHGGEMHWWEWVRIETLWSGPLCTAFRMGGFIEVESTSDEDYAGVDKPVTSPALHLHNWLRGDVYALAFVNGVVHLTCRHINNHLFDHGKDLDDVVPVIGFTPPAEADLPGVLDGTVTRFDLGGVSLNLDEANTFVSAEHPGRLTNEGDVIIYQPYEGVEIRGDSHGRVRDDRYIVKADERRMPKGAARSVPFTIGLGDAEPVVTRLAVPPWQYAVARELWGDDALPVRDGRDRIIERCEVDVRERAASRLRCFDNAVLTREVWEGEIPYSQMLHYYLSGDPEFFEIALTDSYHIADIGFDHATETMRMHNYPFGAISPPLYRTVSMTFAYLETGDPYLLDCSESAATHYYWIDRHNWPRRSVGRDAASVRSLIFLWDYTGKRDYLTMAREVLQRLISTQRPDGSYADQGGAVGMCGGNANEITKPWMAMLANDPIVDYLQRVPGDPSLEEALRRTADFMLAAQLKRNGKYEWAYQYKYGDNPGDPHEMIQDPEHFAPFPTPRAAASGYKARFLPFATLLTGDTRYLEAWQRFYLSNWAIEGQAPHRVGYTTNKMIQYLPFAQSHLWNARVREDGLALRPLLTDVESEMEGTIVSPWGDVTVRCSRRNGELSITASSDSDIKLTIAVPGRDEPVRISANETRTVPALTCADSTA